MRSGCPRNHRGPYPAFQHLRDIGALVSPPGNGVTSVALPANGIQNTMIAARNPGGFGMTYSSALWQKSNTQLQQNFQGLQHQLGYEQFGHLNDSNGLEQRRHLKRGLSGGTSFGANLGDSPGAAAQAVNLQNQSCPMLLGLLLNNPTDEKNLRTTPPSPSKKTYSSVEANPSNHFSDERHCTSQQVRSSPATLNGGQARHFVLLNNKNDGHAHSNRGWSFCTNDSIVQSDCIMSRPSVSHLLTTSASHKEDVESCAVVGQCSVALGQALEEDNSKGSKANAELTPKYEETGAGVESTPGKHATEYPQIQMKVAASHTKNEAQGPVALTALPGMTLDEVTEKHASSALNCSASQEEHRSTGLNISNSLDGLDQARGVSLTPKHKTKREKGDAGIGLDNMPASVTGLSEHLQTRPTSGSVVSENGTFELPSLTEHSRLHPPVDKIQIHNIVSLHPAHSQGQWLCSHTGGVGSGQCVGSVHSQTALRIQLAENKAEEHTPLAESKAEDVLSVTCPLYEDISDDENLRFAAHSKNPLYEDVSEDENPQIENMVLLQVPEPYNKQSLFRNEGYPHVQGQAPMKTDIIGDEERQVAPKTETTAIAQRCSCLRFAETNDAFEGPLCPICDRKQALGWQTNPSAPCIPSSVLDDEGETDDEMDDDWVVFPISMSDLKFEADDDQDLPGAVVLDDCETGDEEKQSDTNEAHSELHSAARKPEAVPASLQLEVFDTPESFLQAKTALYKNKVVASDQSTPQHEMDSVGEPHVNQTRRKSYCEPGDSCETEDSCDYSSGPEHNYLTVSTQLLKKRSETEESKSEKEGQHVTTVQKSQTTLFHKLDYAKGSSKRAKHEISGHKSSQQDHVIIILDSDTEDESDQNCKTNSKRNVLIHSDTEESRYDPYSHHSPGTVDSQSGRFPERLNVTRPSPAPQPQCKAVVSNAHSKVPTDIIVLDSDTEDDDDQNSRKAVKKLFSCSEDSGDATRVQRRRPSAETVDRENGTAGEKRLSASPSVLRDDVMQDEHSDVLHSTEKTKPLIEATGGSENVQHETNKPRVSKKVVKHCFRKKRQIHSSPSADSGDDVIATKNSPSGETEDYHCGISKPKKPRVSPEDASQKWPQSMDKETASSLGRDSLNSRVQAKDKACASKTPTATREKADSCGKKTQHRLKEGKCMSKTKSANDATKNKVQTNMGKPKLVLVPNQRGSASISRSSSTHSQLPESRQSSSSSRGLSQSGETSAASNLPTSKQNTSIPRRLPILQRLHSNGPSTFGHTPSKGPLSAANVKLSAIKQVTADWQKSFSPTRRDRKFHLRMEMDFHAMNYDSLRDTRPQPSRSDKSATPLMKKSKCDAIELTKAKRRDAPRQQGYPVGQGYKWSEKPAVTKPTKGFRREEK